MLDRSNLDTLGDGPLAELAAERLPRTASRVAALRSALAELAPWIAVGSLALGLALGGRAGWVWLFCELLDAGAGHWVALGGATLAGVVPTWAAWRLFVHALDRVTEAR